MNVITAADAAAKEQAKMSTFAITDNNNITVYARQEEAAHTGDSAVTSFDSQAALNKVSAD